MTEQEAEEFVRRFDAAWNDADGPGFAPLWHEDGLLHAPHFGRPIAGREQDKLRAFWKQAVRDYAWRMVDWTHRGNRVCILWESESRVGDKLVTLRGVDWLTVREGRIVEEIVYYDATPLRAVVSGEAPTPLIPF